MKSKGSTIIDIYFPDKEKEGRKKGIQPTRLHDEILGRKRSSPDPAAGVVVCGFECGTPQSVSTFAHLLPQVGVEPEISTAIARNGGRSLRFHPSNQRARVSIKSGYGQTVSIGRVYIYFASMPTGNTGLIHTNTDLGNPGLGIGYHASSGTVRTFWGNILIDARFASSGISVTTGQWYLIDYRFDNTPGAKTADGRVDGVALEQKTSTNTESYVDTITFGSLATNVTFDIYFDDLFAHPDHTLYPLGAGYTKLYIPGADGVHNTQGCFSIADSETGSYSLIDEIPMDTGVPTLADSIVQTTTNTTAYVEHLFSPVGGSPATAPRGVDIVYGSHSNNPLGGDASNGFWKVMVGGKEKASFSVGYEASVDAIGIFYGSYVSGGGFNWTLDKLNNLRLRFGYSSDADPDFHYDGAVIEAEFAE
jgi:hypothetical protein